MSPLLEAAPDPPPSAPLSWLLLITTSQFFERMVSVLRCPQPQKTTALLPFHAGLPHEPRQPVKDIATESRMGHNNGCASGHPSWLCQPCLTCVIHCCLDKANWMLTLPPDTSESKVLPIPSFPPSPPLQEPTATIALLLGPHVPLTSKGVSRVVPSLTSLLH